MPFIIGAIGTVIGSVTSVLTGISGFIGGLGIVGSTLLRVGAVVGLTLLSKAIKPKQKAAQSGGVQAQLQTGGDNPRAGIFGRQALAGEYNYHNTYGDNNKYLQFVFQLGDGEHDTLEKMWANGKPCTLTGTPEARGIPIPEFDSGGQHRMWVRFYNGTIDQAADSGLVTNANPSTRWSEDHRGAGCCYVVVEMLSDDKIFSGGIPTFLFQVRGLKLYDPRKDSTQPGGSGAHRWGQPDTYEWSDNPAICLYNYRRGIYIGDEKVLGMGLPAYDLRTDLYMAAANACDENVNLKAGGTEKRYRCGLTVSDDQPHDEWIGQFLDAMAAIEIDKAGEFGPLAGVSQTPVLTIENKHLLANRPRNYAAKATRTARRNAVFGEYSDPNQQWRGIPFPPRVSSADEAADGGERFGGDNLSLLQVYSGTQAQRISEIIRRKARLTATEEIQVPFAYWRLEPGDWITRISTKPVFTKVMQVLDVKRLKDHNVALQLREIASSVFPWNPEIDELDGQQPVDLPGEGVRQSTVTGLSVTAIEILGADGQKRPALRVQWTPIEDPTIDAVIIEYRIDGTTEVFQIRQSVPASGEALIVNGIQASTLYEVRATIETTPRRIVTWTAWIDATSSANYVVPTAQNVTPGAIDTVALSPELANLIKIDLPALLNDLRQDALRLAQIVSDQDSAQAHDRETSVKKLEAVHNSAKALIIEARDTLVNDIEALAQSIDLLEASINDTVATAISSLETRVTNTENVNAAQATALSVVQAIASSISANGLVRLTAVADSTDGAVAAYDVEVAVATSPGTFRKSGLRIVVWTTGGLFFSRIIFNAQEIWFGTDGGIKVKVDDITGAGTIEIYG